MRAEEIRKCDHCLKSVIDNRVPFFVVKVDTMTPDRKALAMRAHAHLWGDTKRRVDVDHVAVKTLEQRLMFCFECASTTTLEMLVRDVDALSGGGRPA